MKISILDYGAGNIQSLQFALQRLGYEGVLTSDVNKILSSDKVIFPGVGEASNAMASIKKSGLDVLIPTLKMPVLGICLGMQLMCNETQENQTKGLGIFDVSVVKFSNRVKVPQMGWNTIYKLNQKNLFSKISNLEYMYLIHSYFAPICKQTIAVSNYDFEYSSALQNQNFFGTQFHPEKSGKMGAQILSNFLKL